ncbi:ABC transporter ATP-binding protein [Desulfatiglans anilini]|uniref:ABC transporter ATP-binding protein n=1 Tax=Desulfatiglans anilini TaxID=90728 RepID=UPI0003FF8174|nr:ABC transporter ATP-binding protein [Desulfatiglans anilini]
MELKTETLLSVADLHITFKTLAGPAKAVEGVSLGVRRGETVALVGESGCGKSVTALSFLGLLPRAAVVEQGSARLGGVELLGLDEEELRKIRGRRISMVFQEPLTSLNPVFKVGDQIGEAIRVHEAVDEDEIRRRVVTLLRDVGIPNPEERLDDYPHQLSGGQRQRVMIAMALSCNPELMIADEPTTALDVTVQAQILALMRSLQEERRMSILYITHDLGVVSQVAERVYVMYAGMIVEEGRTPTLFEDPRHPYTQGLLASLPSRGKRGRRLSSIPGHVPDPACRPAGCPFHPRCPRAMESCRGSVPTMIDLGDGHQARCLRAHESAPNPAEPGQRPADGDRRVKG